MFTRDEYISLLHNNGATLRKDFGVKSLRLFGSVARGENRPDSDVDVCVEMEPKMILFIRLKNYLEQLLHTSVDLVRMRPGLNPYLKSEIEHDGILILQFSALAPLSFCQGQRCCVELPPLHFTVIQSFTRITKAGCESVRPFVLCVSPKIISTNKTH